MATKIQFRRDLAANWTTNNPVLSEGEMGLETDTGKFKVGNGTGAWTALGYSSGAKGDKGDTGESGPQGDPGPKGDTGDTGPQGVSITNIARASGTGAAGTTDTYTITFSDASTATFTVYNGANGADGEVTLNTTQTLTNKTITGLKETRVAVAASNIDINAGTFFTKTISGTTTFTVSNVPAAGTTASFILDLTNGGAFTVNWWAGVQWAGGTAPALTASGRDSLGFYTHDGGTTWTGVVLGKDIK